MFEKPKSLQSAITMMSPRYGGDFEAQMAICFAIRNGSIQALTTRAAPEHDNDHWSCAHEVNREWFGDHKHVYWALFNTLSEPRLKNEWKNFIFDGGVVFERSEIDVLRKLEPIKHVDSIVLEQFLSNKNAWNLPQVVAWVASGHMPLVFDTKLSAPWREFGNRKIARHHWWNLELTRRRSFGWMVETIARYFCCCQTKVLENRETWESCQCILNALNSILESLAAGEISAFDESCSQLIDRNSKASFRFDFENFTMKGPSPNLLVTLSHAEILSIFPNGPKNGRVLADSQVRDWISSCGETNSKTAWNRFKIEFGPKALKKSLFMDIWKEYVGHRGRGRPKTNN